VNDFASTSAAMNAILGDFEYQTHVIEKDDPTVEANEIFQEVERTNNVTHSDIENRAHTSIMRKNRTRESKMRRKKTQQEVKTLLWRANQESMKDVIESAHREQNKIPNNKCMRTLLILMFLEMFILILKIYISLD
jgi:Asp-tRNA(Asn)/Glu-tRNA(Gln) amidotransferase C subunit